MDLNSSDDEVDEPTVPSSPAQPQPEVIDLSDDDDNGAALAAPQPPPSLEASDLALACRLQQEEYAAAAAAAAAPPSSSGETATAKSAKAKAGEAPKKDPFPPETSAYTLSLDAALDAALAAIAADGAPLFAEPKLLQDVRKLEPAARALCARLLFVTGPWHSFRQYAGYVPQVQEAVAALVQAGALLCYDEASATPELAEELLPTLTVAELRPIRRAVNKAAQEAAEAAEGTLRKLRDEEKGETKGAMLAQIRGRAASCAAVELKLPSLVAEALAVPPAKKRGGGGKLGEEEVEEMEVEEKEVAAAEEGEDAGEGQGAAAAEAGGVAHGPWVRLVPEAELLLQRALRYAERAPRAAARRPVPATKMMVAMLQARSRRDLPNALAVISPPISP